ncbi:hypothetical protein N665_0431s0003 [Sinapis alba]|nr:hypothetical protein N665_0431s0003 [Sinapis alba]
MSVNRDEEEPFESLEEIEARTIGNLLPADEDDDFFAGVVGHNSRPNDLDDDFDLFSSVGGMELDVSVSGEEEVTLSRTLFVRNMDSIIEDSELSVLFEQYGDVRSLHTASKNRGFIMVSYYDIRAAQNAMRALHGRLLRGRKLHIHYPIPKENTSIKENTNEGALLVNNLDSSVSNEEFQRIVYSYGEIREVRHENSQIYIEFFDVRAAEAALRGLNGLEIAGRQLKLAPSCPQEAALRGLNGLEIAGRQLKLAPSCPQGTISFTPTDDFERVLSKMAFTNLSSAQIGRHFPGGILASTTSIDVGSPVNSFIERHQSPNGLPPSTRIISASKPVDLQSFDSSKIAVQSMPNLHPHEYLDNFASGSPLNQGSLRANHNLRSSSNTQLHSPSSGIVWPPNSPSRGNSIPPQCIPPPFSRTSPLMVHHHHIGSAPVLNSPFWDTRQAYVAESQRSSGFHMGSHGGSSMEMGSHKVFGGNLMNANSKNAVLRSSPHMSHLYNGRSPMLSVPGSFGLFPNERYRNDLSHRRSDSSSSNNAEKKLYELDVDRILRGEDSRTTLMIKNIPNKYTSKMLLAAINEYCKGTYDFFYLPIDFKNKCNVGYAFINLTKPENIVPLYKVLILITISNNRD